MRAIVGWLGLRLAVAEVRGDHLDRPVAIRAHHDARAAARLDQVPLAEPAQRLAQASAARRRAGATARARRGAATPAGVDAADDVGRASSSKTVSIEPAGSAGAKSVSCGSRGRRSWSYQLVRPIVVKVKHEIGVQIFASRGIEGSQTPSNPWIQESGTEWKLVTDFRTGHPSFFRSRSAPVVTGTRSATCVDSAKRDLVMTSEHVLVEHPRVGVLTAESSPVITGRLA